MAILPSVSDYAKNLAKSTLFATAEVSEKLMPGYADFKESNKEVFKEVYLGIKDYKKTISRVQAAIVQSKIYQAAEVGLNNLKEDLKTGNWYNQNRVSSYEKKSIEASFNDSEFSIDESGLNLGDAGGDLNVDDSFLDESEFNVDENGLDITDGDALVANAIKETGQDVATVISATNVEVAKSSQKANKIASGMLYAQNEKMMKIQQEGFSAMTQSINNILQFDTEALKTHLDNSKTFFEQASKRDDERNAMLKEILEMQRNQYKKLQLDEEKKEEKKKTGWGDISLSGGFPSLENYGKAIQENFMRTLEDKTGGAFSMLNSMGGSMGDNPLLALVQNPMGSIVSSLVTLALGPRVLRAAENLDKTASGIFGTMISKFNRMANEDDGINGILGSIFGIRNTLKTSIDSTAYKRGPTQWNGDDHRALTEVIPHYLANIDAAVSGRPHQLFDYETGRYELTADLQSRWNDMLDRYRMKPFQEINQAMMTYFRNMEHPDRETKVQLTKDWLSLMRQFYSQEGSFQDIIKTNVKDEERMSDLSIDTGVSEENLSTIINFIQRWAEGDSADKSKNKKLHTGDLMRVSGEIMDVRAQQNREVQNLQERGSIMGQLFNNGFKQARDIRTGELNNAKTAMQTEMLLKNQYDNKGQNIFYYLQNILQALVSIKVDGINTGIEDRWIEAFKLSSTKAKQQKQLSQGAENVYHDEKSAYADISARSSFIEDRHDNSEFWTPRRRYTDQQNRMNESHEKSFQRQVERQQKEGASYKGPELIYGVDENGQPMSITDEQELLNKRALAALETIEKMSDNVDKEDKANRGLFGEFIDSFKSEENDEERRKAIQKIQRDGFLDSLIKAESLGEKWNILKLSLEDLADKPADMLAGIMESADEKLYRFFFKEEEIEVDGVRYSGFFGRLNGEMRLLFKDINEGLNKHLLEPLMEKLGAEGPLDLINKGLQYVGIDVESIWQNFSESFGETFDNVKDRVKDTFTEFFQDAIDEIKTEEMKAKEAAEKAKNEAESNADTTLSQGIAASDLASIAPSIDPYAINARIMGDLEQKLEDLQISSISDLREVSLQLDQLISTGAAVSEENEGLLSNVMSQLQEIITSSTAGSAEIVQLQETLDKNTKELNEITEKLSGMSTGRNETGFISNMTDYDNYTAYTEAKTRKETEVKNIQDKIDELLKGNLTEEEYNKYLTFTTQAMQAQTARKEQRKKDEQAKQTEEKTQQEAESMYSRLINQRFGPDLNLVNDDKKYARELYDKFNARVKSSGTQEELFANIADDRMKTDLQELFENNKGLVFDMKSEQISNFLNNLGFDQTTITEVLDRMRESFVRDSDANIDSLVNVDMIQNKLVDLARTKLTSLEEFHQIHSFGEEDRQRDIQRVLSLYEQPLSTLISANVGGRITDEPYNRKIIGQESDEEEPPDDLLSIFESNSRESTTQITSAIDNLRESLGIDTSISELFTSLSTSITDKLGEGFSSLSTILADINRNIEAAAWSNIGTHAEGAYMITKPGLTAISDGEMIVPANLNPFNPNRDNVNISAQLANEQRIKQDYGNFIAKQLVNQALPEQFKADSIPLNASGWLSVDLSTKAGQEDYVNRLADEISSKVQVNAQGRTKTDVTKLTGQELDDYKAKATSLLQLMEKIKDQHTENKVTDESISLIKEWLVKTLGKDNEEVDNMKRTEVLSAIEEQMTELRESKAATAESSYTTNDDKQYSLDDIKALVTKVRQFKAKDKVDDLEEWAKNNPQMKALGDSVNSIASGIRDAVTESLGLDTVKVKKTIKEATETVKQGTPDIVAKGLLGGVGGLFIGGPLVGALLGAGVGLVQNNEYFMEQLFGKNIVDENGKKKREGGIIDRDTMDTFQKYAMPAFSHGALGSVLGLVTPFGPLGGAIIGSSIGLLRKNKEFMDIFFGEEDGLIDKKTQAFIKKSYPNMAVAAIGTLFLGPFGLLGNAALGASVGLLGSTDTFKNYIFGVEDPFTHKREGGFVGAIREGLVDPLLDFGKKFAKDTLNWLHEDIFDPLKNAILPIGKQLQLGVTGLVKGLGMYFGHFFEVVTGRPFAATLRDYFLTPLAKLGTGALDFILKPIRSAIALPFKGIGMIGDIFKRRQVQQGTATYMTAAQRDAYRKDKGMDETTEQAQLDKNLARSNIDELQKLQATLKILKGGDKELDRVRGIKQKQLWTTIDRTLGKGDFKILQGLQFERDRINELLSEGKEEEAMELIQKKTEGLEFGKRQDILSQIIAAHRDVKQAKMKLENYKKDKSSASDILEKELGIKIGDHNVDDILALVTKEISAHKEDQEKIKNAGIDEIGSVEKSEGALLEATQSQTEVLGEKLDEVIKVLKVSIDPDRANLTDQQKMQLAATTAMADFYNDDINYRHAMKSVSIENQLKDKFGNDFKVSEYSLDLLDTREGDRRLKQLLSVKDNFKIDEKSLEVFMNMKAESFDRMIKLFNTTGLQMQNNLKKLDDIKDEQLENVINAHRLGLQMDSIDEYKDVNDIDVLKKMAQIRQITGLTNRTLDTKGLQRLIDSGLWSLIVDKPEDYQNIQEKDLKQLGNQTKDIQQVGYGDGKTIDTELHNQTLANKAINYFADIGDTPKTVVGGLLRRASNKSFFEEGSRNYEDLKRFEAQSGIPVEEILDAVTKLGIKGQLTSAIESNATGGVVESELKNLITTSKEEPDKALTAISEGELITKAQPIPVKLNDDDTAKIAQSISAGIPTNAFGNIFETISSLGENLNTKISQAKETATTYITNKREKLDRYLDSNDTIRRIFNVDNGVPFTTRELTGAIGKRALKYFVKKGAKKGAKEVSKEVAIDSIEHELIDEATKIDPTAGDILDTIIGIIDPDIIELAGKGFDVLSSADKLDTLVKVTDPNIIEGLNQIAMIMNSFAKGGIYEAVDKAQQQYQAQSVKVDERLDEANPVPIKLDDNSINSISNMVLGSLPTDSLYQKIQSQATPEVAKAIISSAEDGKFNIDEVLKSIGVTARGGRRFQRFIQSQMKAGKSLEVAQQAYDQKQIDKRHADEVAAYEAIGKQSLPNPVPDTEISAPVVDAAVPVQFDQASITEIKDYVNARLEPVKEDKDKNQVLLDSLLKMMNMSKEDAENIKIDKEDGSTFTLIDKLLQEIQEQEKSQEQVINAMNSLSSMRRAPKVEKIQELLLDSNEEVSKLSGDNLERLLSYSTSEDNRQKLYEEIGKVVNLREQKDTLDKMSIEDIATIAKTSKGDRYNQAVARAKANYINPVEIEGKSIEEIEQLIQEHYYDPAAVLGRIIKSAKEAFTGSLASTLDTSQGIVDNIRGKIQRVQDWGTNKKDQFIEFASDQMDQFSIYLNKKFIALSDAIGSGIDEVKDAMLVQFRSGAKWLTEKYDKFMADPKTQEMLGKFTDFFSTVKDTAKTIFDYGGERAGLFFETMKDTIEEKAKWFFDKSKDFLKEALEPFTNEVKEFAGNIWDGTKSFMKDIVWGGVKKTGSKALELLMGPEGSETFQEKWKNRFASMGDNLKSFNESLKERTRKTRIKRLARQEEYEGLDEDRLAFIDQVKQAGMEDRFTGNFKDIKTMDLEEGKAYLDDLMGLDKDMDLYKRSNLSNIEAMANYKPATNATEAMINKLVVKNQREDLKKQFTETGISDEKFDELLATVEPGKNEFLEKALKSLFKEINMKNASKTTETMNLFAENTELGQANLAALFNDLPKELQRMKDQEVIDKRHADEVAAYEAMAQSQKENTDSIVNGFKDNIQPVVDAVNKVTETLQSASNKPIAESVISTHATGATVAETVMNSNKIHPSIVSEGELITNAQPIPVTLPEDIMETLKGLIKDVDAKEQEETTIPTPFGIAQGKKSLDGSIIPANKDAEDMLEKVEDEHDATIDTRDDVHKILDLLEGAKDPEEKKEEEQSFWDKILALLGSGIAALLAWLKKFKLPNFSELGGKLSDAWARLVKAVEEKWDKFSKRFSEVWIRFSQQFEETIARIRKLPEHLEEFVKRMKEIPSRISEFFNKHFKMPKIGESFERLIDRVETKFGSMIDNVGIKFGSLFGGLSERLGSSFGEIGERVSNATENLISKLPTDTLKQGGEAISERLNERLGQFGDSITRLGEGTDGRITQAMLEAGVLGAGIKGKFTDIAESVGSKFTGITGAEQGIKEQAMKEMADVEKYRNLLQNSTTRNIVIRDIESGAITKGMSPESLAKLQEMINTIPVKEAAPAAEAAARVSEGVVTEAAARGAGAVGVLDRAKSAGKFIAKAPWEVTKFLADAAIHAPADAVKGINTMIDVSKRGVSGNLEIATRGMMAVEAPGELSKGAKLANFFLNPILKALSAISSLIGKIIGHIPGANPAGMSSALQKFAVVLSEKVAQKAGASLAGKALLRAIPFLGQAYMAYAGVKAFYHGFSNPGVVLGIADSDKIGMGQRLLAAIANAVIDLCTFGILEGGDIVPTVVRILGPYVGADDTLKEMEDSNQQFQAWKEKTGNENATFEDFLKETGNYNENGILDNVTMLGGMAVDWIKEKATNIVTGFVNLVTTVPKQVIEWANEKIQGIFDFAGSVKEISSYWDKLSDRSSEIMKGFGKISPERLEQLNKSVEIADDDPLKGFKTPMKEFAANHWFITGTIGWGLGKIGSLVGDVFEGIGNVLGGIKDSVVGMGTGVIEGDPFKVLKSVGGPALSAISGEGSAAKGIGALIPPIIVKPLLPIALAASTITWGIKQVKEFFETPMISLEGVSIGLDATSDMFGLAKKGDLQGLLQYQNPLDKDDSVGGYIGSAIVKTSKVLFVPGTAIANALGSVREFISKQLDAMAGFKFSFDFYINFKGNPFSKDYLDHSEVRYDPNNPISIVPSILDSLVKYFMLPVKALGKFADWIGDKFKGLKDIINKIKNIIPGMDSQQKSMTTTNNKTTTDKDKTGKGKDVPSLYGRAISNAVNYSQVSDDIKNMPMTAPGDSKPETVLSRGCSVTIGSAMSKFGVMPDKKDLIKDAKPYLTKDDGTGFGYFNKEASKYGMKSTQTSDSTKVIDHLKRGGSSVIMGSGNGLFGNGHHYVTASALGRSKKTGKNYFEIQDPAELGSRLVEEKQVTPYMEKAFNIKPNNTGRGRLSENDPRFKGNSDYLIHSDDDSKVRDFKAKHQEEWIKFNPSIAKQYQPGDRPSIGDISTDIPVNLKIDSQNDNVVTQRQKRKEQIKWQEDSTKNKIDSNERGFNVSRYGKGTDDSLGDGPNAMPPFGNAAVAAAKKLGNSHPELMWGQMMVETGGPENTGYWGFENHNYAGIKWISAMGDERKSDILCPSGEASGPVPYAKFKDDADFANFWYDKVLKLYPGTDKASTPTEWANALAPHDGKGDYYECSNEQYAAGIQAHLNNPKYKESLKKLTNGEITGASTTGSSDTSSSGSSNSSSSGSSDSSSSGGLIDKVLNTVLNPLVKLFNAIFGGGDSGSSSGSTPGSTSSGSSDSSSSSSGNVSSLGGDIEGASKWADEQVGSQGFGNNGCTEWVRRYLEKAGSPFAKMMTAGTPTAKDCWDGHEASLMWVPSIYTYAKENNLYKPGNAPGARGDIAMINTNGSKEDGPDHVVIAKGDGNYWGNSSSRNQIVSSNIAGDYGSDNILGYVATGEGGGTVSEGKVTRSQAEIDADAGSSASSTGKGKNCDITLNECGNLDTYVTGKGKYGRERSTDATAPDMWKYIKSKGVSDVTTAGIMGNLFAESSLYSDRLQNHGVNDGSKDVVVDGYTGYGLAQWTSENRQANLKQFQESHGREGSDWKGQIDFLVEGHDEPITDVFKKMDETKDPHKAALIFHKDFERSADTEEMAARRGEYAKEFFDKQGGAIDGSTNVSASSNSSSSGSSVSSSSSGGNIGLIDQMLNKAFAGYTDLFNKIFGGGDSGSSSGSTPGSTSSGSSDSSSSSSGNVSSLGGDIEGASKWADEQVGSQGFGNNGCTEWVKRYLLKANSPFGKLMQEGTVTAKDCWDGHEASLMWVPSIYTYAKENNLYKPGNAPGARGDIAMINTNGNKEDGPDHVVIAKGDGNYWGNSSRKNQIVSSNIVNDYGSENLLGYVATGEGSGGTKIEEGKATRSQAEIDADAGSSASSTGKGKNYNSLNDLDALMSEYSDSITAKDIDRIAVKTKQSLDLETGKYGRSNNILESLLSGLFTINADKSEENKEDIKDPKQESGTRNKKNSGSIFDNLDKYRTPGIISSKINPIGTNADKSEENKEDIKDPKQEPGTRNKKNFGSIFGNILGSTIDGLINGNSLKDSFKNLINPKTLFGGLLDRIGLGGNSQGGMIEELPIPENVDLKSIIPQIPITDNKVLQEKLKAKTQIMDEISTHNTQSAVQKPEQQTQNPSQAIQAEHYSMKTNIGSNNNKVTDNSESSTNIQLNEFGKQILSVLQTIADNTAKLVQMMGNSNDSNSTQQTSMAQNTINNNQSTMNMFTPSSGPNEYHGSASRLAQMIQTLGAK